MIVGWARYAGRATRGWLVRWAVILILAVIAGAETKWPSGVSAAVAQPCVFQEDFPNSHQVGRLAGTLNLVFPEPWREITLGARIAITGLGGSRSIYAKTSIKTLYTSHPFTISFGQATLSGDEKVSDCVVEFVMATRIQQKMSTVTKDETPAAKDDDCLADLIKAQVLKGLDFRKRMTELLQYGCVRVVPAGWMAISKTIEERKVGGVPVVRAMFTEDGISSKFVIGTVLASGLTTVFKPFLELVNPTVPK